MKEIDLNDYVTAMVCKELKSFASSLSKNYEFEICCDDVGKLIVWTKNPEFYEFDINLNLHGLIKKVVGELDGARYALEDYKKFFEQQIKSIEKMQKKLESEE